MTSISGRMAVYIVAVECLGLGLMFYTARHFPIAGDLVFWLLVAGFVALTALSDRYGLHFARGTNIHVDTIPLFASLLLFNPAVALIVAGVGRLAGVIKSHRPAVEVAFNFGQTLTYAGISALALNRFATPPWQPEGGAAWAGLLTAAGIMYGLNHALVAGIVSLQAQQRFLRSWISALKSNAPEHGVMFSLGLITALLVELHPWGLLLITIPSVIVFVTLDRTLRMEAQQKRLAEENASLAAWLSVQTEQLRHAYRSVEQRLDAKNRTFQMLLGTLQPLLVATATSADMLHQKAGALVPVHPLPELDALAHNIREMTGLIEKFLALHALDRYQLEMTRFTVEELLRGSLEAVAQRSDEAGVDIYGEYTAEVPLLRGDRPRLVLMLSSLLEAAITLSRRGDEIWLKATPAADNMVQFAITCHATTLRPEVLPHLFEWPTSAEVSEALNGYGLNLATAQHVALLHGGRVWAESQGENTIRLCVALPGMEPSNG